MKKSTVLDCPASSPRMSRRITGPVRWLMAFGLVLFSWQPAQATNHFVRINELMAGLNGDSSIQFFEMVAQGAGQKNWGPNGASVGRTMVVFHDSGGVQTGRFVVPSNPGGTADTVLFATQAFADLTGITPDFIIPEGVMPIAGKVCFKSNPDNIVFTISLCLSYGGSGFTGATEEDSGSPHASDLLIMNSQSLSRNTNFTFSDAPNFGVSNTNASFVLATPTPNSTQNNVGTDSNFNGVFDDDDNSVGQAALPVASSLVDQGEDLFVKERFLGNGRTCATCHLAGDSFGLTPTTVAGLPSTDLLFMNTVNVNTLVVNSAGSVNPGAASGTSQPSDFFLGGTITGSMGGSATVLAGTGTTYLILGGSDLNVAGNVISDGSGNTGTLVSFTAGNLVGPNPVNSEARGIEDTTFLTGGRALITENINGFPETTFMRTSPNLLNLKHTAPYGLSGEFADLQTFSNGAVQQHFPRRLERVAGVDFRSPTTAELSAMEAFMNSIFLPSDEDFDESNNFDKFVTTEAQKRGRTLFFGTAKCEVCHNGKVLATSDGQFGTTVGVNEEFDTGVSNLPINTTEGLPTEQDLGSLANSRKFSTRPLFGVKNTAPFFHDNSFATLLEAVQFYDTAIFRSSPAFAQVGAMDDVGILQNAQDIVAFLEGLVELPFTFTGTLSFGSQSVAGGATAAMTLTLTHTGTEDLTIDSLTLNGTNPGEFANTSPMADSGPFSNGQSRTIDVTFDPSSDGAKEATLELTISSSSDSWDVGVALNGTGLAPEITVSPTDLTFGSRDVGAGATASQMVTITNDGSATLNISSVSVVGGDAAEFNVATDSGETMLAPAASRTVTVNFDPSSAGAKSANLRISSDDSNEATVDVALSGTGLGSSISVTPSFVAFGAQITTDGATASRTVTITSDGSSPLNISSVSVVGADALQFNIASDSGEATLAPAASRTVTINFDPSSFGAKSANLRILSDDPGDATIDVSLSGEGVSAADLIFQDGFESGDTTSWQ